VARPHWLLLLDVGRHAPRPSVFLLRHSRAPTLTKAESRQANWRWRQLNRDSSSGDSHSSSNGRGGASSGTPGCRRIRGPGPWCRHPGQERRGTLEGNGGGDGPVRPVRGSVKNRPRVELLNPGDSGLRSTRDTAVRGKRDPQDEGTGREVPGVRRDAAGMKALWRCPQHPRIDART
jgi:hypothetical protein